MTPPVRVGLLGCGRAAERLHLPAIRRAPAARLMAVFDPIMSRRELIASGQPGCRSFESAESLVSSGEVDAVIVATPAESHVDVACVALRAGLPVLVEKPLATSLRDARRLDAVQRGTGVPVMVALNRRWWDPADRLRRHLCRTGRGQASVRMEIASDVRSWSALSALSDPLDDLGTHHLDLLRFLFGCEIESVRATRPGPAEFQLVVRLEDGTTATCVAAYRDRSVEVIQVAVGAERSCVHAGSERIGPAPGAMRRALDLADAVRRRALRRRGSLARSYDRQLSSFVACVRDRKPASPGVRDGLAVLRAIEAARASLVSGGADIPITSTPEP